ncbi:MAG: ORF6N domain-containing protein [Bacteroidales bacterium]|jgi:phage regulator Rha-like protein|nr:ORF6N domain-containing protein [Bacteroidales bacterium]MDD4742832.1 ORF6N domain-containing protein [Bacteroidales bacterium]
MELQQIQQKIYDIRDQKVMLDFDLAELYETETKRLKEAVRRNIGRFPPDFMFELTKAEFDVLRTQFATSKRGGTRYMPFAFTEQGVAMLASVLNSPKAIDVNIQIVRAFVFLRKYALSHKELSEKLKQLENKYDLQFKGVYEAIEYLFKKDRQDSEQKNRKRIGY